MSVAQKALILPHLILVWGKKWAERTLLPALYLWKVRPFSKINSYKLELTEALEGDLAGEGRQKVSESRPTAAHKPCGNSRSRLDVQFVPAVGSIVINLVRLVSPDERCEHTNGILSTSPG